MKKIFVQTIMVLFASISATSIIMASQAGSETPTFAELKDATYSVMEDEIISLSGGIWEGETYVEGGAARPRVGLVDNVYYTGDLDGDGTQEAVVILWQSGGGTGENTYVMVMARQNGEIKNVGSALIGDRVKLRSGKIANENIILEVLQVGENDAMCCPTMLATRTWSLQGGQLEEGEIEVTGELSISALEGTDWVLTHMDRNKPLAEGAEVTLAFADGRIAGKSACNRYFAGIEDGKNAGEIKIGQAGSTMMACPDELMKIERRYLNSLLKVTKFSFHAGNLALSGQKEAGAVFSMLFRKRK